MRLSVGLPLSLLIAVSSSSEVRSQDLPLDRFLETGRIEGGTTLHLWDLASANPEKYETVFARSVVPSLEDFRGHRFNGMILHVKSWRFGKYLVTQYMGRNRDLLTGKMYARPLTFQKRFFPQDNDEGESGINYWPVRGVESMPMKIYISTGIRDAKKSLKVDYNVPRNRAVTQRPLLDEIRQLPGTALYIGKMYYRAHDHHIPFLWFAVERVES